MPGAEAGRDSWRNAAPRTCVRHNTRNVAQTAYHLRRPDQLASCFDGLDLVEPGVVPCSLWKPDMRDANPAPADQAAA
ncbi:MAG: SAM-dependent methyltransferase [Streptosporangiaceae bacterium]